MKRVLLLTGGIVKITHLGPSGAEVILRLKTRGDILGVVDLFFNGKHATTAQVFRSCAALVWDAEGFRILLERFPILYQNMARLLVVQLGELAERFREMATEKVDSRVARQIVRLVSQVGQRVHGAIRIGVSREDVAQMTGTTLFTVSRLLSGWESRGIVTARREAVIVCDVEALRAISEASE